MKEAEKEFINYTNDYLDYGEKVLLKKKHTFRVQKLCCEIAKSLKLSEEEVEIAGICGLLHDIGRFEQWKKFHKLEDRDTIDHGDLGYKILKTNNYLQMYNKKEEYDSIILKSVKYHNKYKIPDNLNKKEKIFVNIVRDADKLDLLYLYTINIFNFSDENKPFCKEVYETLLNKKPVYVGDLKSDIDKDALRLGFAFDINYKYSFKLLKKKGYIKSTIEKQKKATNCKELVNQLNEIEKVINSHIEEMITC